MKSIFIKYFNWMFLVLAVLELSAVLWKPEVRYVTKPAIVISLILYYKLSVTRIDSLFLIALIFALAGDTFLMFDGFFLFGLVSFLIMQLLYAICFKKHRGTKTNLKLVLSVLVIGLTIISALYLFPHAGEMAIPVLVYTAVILLMVLSGIWRKHDGSHYPWILYGVLSFLISDGILAINRFANPFESAGFLVMLTYILAQFLIVNGYIQYQRQEAQA